MSKALDYDMLSETGYLTLSNFYYTTLSNYFRVPGLNTCAHFRTPTTYTRSQLKLVLIIVSVDVVVALYMVVKSAQIEKMFK